MPSKHQLLHVRLIDPRTIEFKLSEYVPGIKKFAALRLVSTNQIPANKAQQALMLNGVITYLEYQIDIFIKNEVGNTEW